MINPVVVQNMKSKLEGKHFLKLADFTKAELMDLIRYTIQLKNMQKVGESHQLLKGKTLAMIFEKSSTRTRVSFETGMYQLGGHAMFLNKNDLQIGNGETIADTAKVLSRYVDGIMIRTYDHAIVEELADNASIPIINGLTDDFHPCQVLADLVTIYEEKGSFKGLKLAFVGDGNNMAQSLLMGCAIMGIDCTVASPDNSQVDPEVFKQVMGKAAVSGAKIEQTNDPHKAVEGADVIYTDVWASMGWNGDLEKRKQSFMKFQVNDELVKEAKEDYLFLHCLPAHREEEVTGTVIDGDHSVVFDQAENRLHAQKAILTSLL
ncbi:ornithine carbamoyltransferase [Virgibacillus sp. W0181]|uniref:ornithine carbamoyltransferase n=1 Tax=Virgibacillus sp. W0181 TaxID=3391581 RepID=UPI003F472ABC